MCLWLLFYTDWFIHSLVLIWLTGFFSHVSSSPLTSIAHPSVLPTLLHIVINFLVFFSRRSRSDWQGHARRGFSSSRRAHLCVWLGICVCVCVCESVLTSFILSFRLSWCEPWRLCITVYSVLEGTVIDGFIMKTQWIISCLDAGRRWLQRVRKRHAEIPRSPFGPGWARDNVGAKPRQKRSKSGLI